MTPKELTAKLAALGMPPQDARAWGNGARVGHEMAYGTNLRLVIDGVMLKAMLDLFDRLSAPAASAAPAAPALGFTAPPLAAASLPPLLDLSALAPPAGAAPADVFVL